jgi:hypothetical protein
MDFGNLKSHAKLLPSHAKIDLGMPTITDLYNIHLRQLDLTLAESELLLQREGGLDGELKTSGSLCEQFLRKMLTKYVVPGQFRVTSGYIATPDLLAQKKNLPQCDILIADNYIPALLRLADAEIEVLPFESIIGVIEAKRTLTKKSLSNALDHLKTVVASTNQLSTLKTDKELKGFNKYAGFHNHSSNKPLLGVVALTSGLNRGEFESEVEKIIEEKNSLVDFVWTLDGFAVVPAFAKDGKQVSFYTHSARPETKSWTQLTENDFQTASSEFYKNFSGIPRWVALTPSASLTREAVLAKVIGLMSLTMSRIFPGIMQEQQINEYYINTH